MTIKKKIAAVAAAAMMAMSMTAISASADYDCTLDHEKDVHELNGAKIFGIVAAGEKYNTIERVPINHNIMAGTFYEGEIKKMYVSLDIVRYPEGGLLDRVQRVEPDYDIENLVGVSYGTDKDYGRVSLFSSHEVTAVGGATWGEYNGLANVR